MNKEETSWCEKFTKDLFLPRERATELVKKILSFRKKYQKPNQGGYSGYGDMKDAP